MASISRIQLRSQAVVLAQEGYSDTIIAQKLNRSKRCITNVVCRSREDQ